MASESYIESKETATVSSSEDGDFVDFMSDIGDINSLLDKYQRVIDTISGLHREALAQAHIENTNEIKLQIDNLVSQASALQLQLKTNIKSAQLRGIADSAKQAQAEHCRSRFLCLIQKYRVVEANYREASKDQAKRQYMVVQPDATPQEVDAAINDAAGQQIFSQALLNANRRGQAKTALDEVQARHQELLRLETTMAELTQLFNDMEELVVEQQLKVDVVEKSTESAQVDLEQGIGHTNKAVKSARQARKNKIRCYAILFIVVAIVIVLAVVPAVVSSRR